MGRLFSIALFLVVLGSCKESENYNVQADIRVGNKFYSIHLSPEGKAYVIKGTGSSYTEPLKINKSDTSNIFKLDSIDLFYGTLNKIKNNPIIGEQRLAAQRAEIYYDNKKIYDTYKTDEEFWQLFRPIMEQLPKGYNPFRVKDNIFYEN